MNANNDIREFSNALVIIKGNAMRHANSVYSIKNIVSMTFDSIRKEIPEPDSINDKYRWSKFFFKYFIYSLMFIITLIVLHFNTEFDIDKTIDLTRKYIGINYSEMVDYIRFFLLITPISFALSVLLFIIATLSKWNHSPYYYIHGLRIIFVNNTTLYFVANSDTGFIKDTLKGLERFISNPSFRDNNEMVINFSNRSVNIKEVKDSNVIGGDVEGNISNG